MNSCSPILTAFRRFRSDDSGDVAIVFALSAVALVLAIGAAVDIGRWLHARDQTSAAVDAAVLAGGRYLQTHGMDKSGAISVAASYYQQNVTSRLPVYNDSIGFTIADDGMGVVANGAAFIKTPFLQLANINALPLFSKGQQPIARSQIAVGGSGGMSLEVAMMLDVTGSMAKQKLLDLKDAAKDLINIVVWDDQSKYTSKVAIVPFSEDIRLPTSALDAARGTGLTSCKQLKNGSASACTGNLPKNSYRYYLSPCIVERKGTQKYTDAAPGSNQYVMAEYTRNGSCVIPSTAEVVPLSSD